MTALQFNAASRIDPTGTLPLRNRFARQMEARFSVLKTDIRASIVEEDCFGIQPEVSALQGNARTRRKEFAFVDDTEKVRLFMAWLETLERENVLALAQPQFGLRAFLGSEAPPAAGGWTNESVREAYESGLRDARRNLIRSGYDLALIEALPVSPTYLTNPAHARRVAILFQRSFDDLQTVTQFMNGAIRRQVSEGLTVGLARGIAEGKNPRAIALDLVRDVNRNVDQIGINRARLIARTEVIRAHHLAKVEEFERVDASMLVDVLAEILTANNPCPICIDLKAGGPYTLAVVRGLIPAHPQCRCSVAPQVMVRSQDRQERILTRARGRRSAA